MARINQEILDELVEDCSEGNDEYVVSKWIIEKVPAIFNGNFEQFVKVKLSIAKQLGIDSCSVVFVGSSCTGSSRNRPRISKCLMKSQILILQLCPIIILMWHGDGYDSKMLLF